MRNKNFIENPAEENFHASHTHANFALTISEAISVGGVRRELLILFVMKLLCAIYTELSEYEFHNETTKRWWITKM